jgi:hypothetical protein
LIADPRAAGHTGETGIDGVLQHRFAHFCGRHAEVIGYRAVSAAARRVADITDRGEFEGEGIGSAAELVGNTSRQRREQRDRQD